MLARSLSYQLFECKRTIGLGLFCHRPCSHESRKQNRQMKKQITTKRRNTCRTKRILGVSSGVIVGGLLFVGSVQSADKWEEVENVHNGRAPLCHHIETGALKFCSDIQQEHEEP